MMASMPFELLYVDDNPGDIELFHEAVAGSNCHLQIAHCGQSALDILYHRGVHAHVPRPHLMVMDWNMPGLHGAELLQQIKSCPALCDIPTIVFSSSQSPRDVQASYDCRANAYIVKPVDLDQFLSVVRRMVEFWRRVTRPYTINS